ncbi:GyrI-like domain-containing protein [Ancylobacter sp. IITR112]|uniref:GyrI-like domain-containing protein n=1 Tax=Ancylobacter sp. IITR112 TaxID=3138073 RepID=UPI00352AECD1
MMVIFSARLPRRLLVLTMLLAGLALPATVRAQDAASPPTSPPASAPGEVEPAAPDAAPLDDDGMVAPPMVDPRAVETQNVAPAPDPMTRPDGFGEESVMKPVPVLMKAGHANWDDAFRTIVAALKQIDAEMARLKLKPNGASFIIYTATDDLGFDFEAAVPFEGATTDKPQNGMMFSASPAGRALRFTHRGPYDAMDPTYEQIANLLDAKDLEAQDLYVEEYRSDPRNTPEDDLVIDIWVPLK